MTKKLRVWRCSFRLDKWRLLQDEVSADWGKLGDCGARTKKDAKMEKCKKITGL
jgi:hypothetical protein